jgi:hypothetical protein
MVVVFVPLRSVFFSDDVMLFSSFVSIVTPAAFVFVVVVGDVSLLLLLVLFTNRHFVGSFGSCSKVIVSDAAKSGVSKCVIL